MTILFIQREEVLREMYCGGEPDDRRIHGILDELCLARSIFHTNEQNVKRFLNSFSGE